MGPAADHRRSSQRFDGQPVAANDQIPLIGRFFPAPVAAKVPEIIFLFWVVKILTTAGGEVTSDYLKTYGNFGGGGTEIAIACGEPSSSIAAPAAFDAVVTGVTLWEFAFAT